MPSCVYKNCSNYYKKVNKAQGISYHMFPTDEVQRQEWITIVRMQRNELNWIPSKNTIICSDHFKSSDKVISDKGLTRLRKNAIPFIKKCEDLITQDSPSSSILESQRNMALKNRINQLILKNIQLQKVNKTLRRQNNRLKERVTSVTVILKDLEQKNFEYLKTVLSTSQQ